MEELELLIQDILLEYQDLYETGNPDSYITQNVITLIYNTNNANAMKQSILNSNAIPLRTKEINLYMTDITYTNNALIVEFQFNQP